MSLHYYNDNDRFAAAWLRELIKDGQIPQGEVDERSIADVQPGDLAGFTSCHFFAGVGGWPYALRLAGWPDDLPVWTGSCPCQPFSQVGKRKGKKDSRHLWPELYRLIKECRAAVVFGEQVAFEKSTYERRISQIRQQAKTGQPAPTLVNPHAHADPNRTAALDMLDALAEWDSPQPDDDTKGYSEF